tara:strand:- start:345 stop:785 length:441 start_codon:yes stop_codon:yes gene_type:complete
MKILKKPDVFLKGPTQNVEIPLSDENKIIIGNMINIMYQSNGVGLAANQVGYNRRIFVIDSSNERNKPQIFINPKIEKRAKEKLTEEEGCLSCPGDLIQVRRPIYVALSWFCEHGKEQYKTFYHLPARIVQHEMDHLDGKLITDLS